MNKLKAINPKHQSMVNRCISWLCKYNEYDRLRNLADDSMGFEDFDDSVAKAYRKADKKCISSFDKYLEYLSELPKREVANIESSEYY
tara:strand:+ start:1843 stop:2106 length:264 start_codon:yes stop_codon:yes gene_type:complete